MSDDISQLPDCILHHILSFIPTKDVLKTSILSKRWINLWTSVPNLDFDDALLYATEMDDRDFMDFVEKVLLLRDASDIEKFRLSCRVCFNATRIHSWISAAINHNVKNLDLCLFVEDPPVLPSSIFSSISLTSLKIEMNCVLELPTNISFPGLKTLHLSLITFPDDDSTQNLFLGCPVLINLVMVDCEWSNLKSLMISSLTLKSLTIDDLPYFGPPDSPSGCKIVIDTPNLKDMKYTGYLSNEIYLLDVSALLKAYISVPNPCKRKKEVTRHVFNLVNGLRGVASLTLSNCIIESLVCAGEIPVFKNLTNLELSMQIGNIYEALMELFIRCPNLQSLVFEEGFRLEGYGFENNDIWSSLPKSISSRLKTLTFTNFHGYESEICFLKCVLKHALVSEKIDISFCKSPPGDGDPNRQKRIRKDLVNAARGWRSCVVKFS